MVSSTSSMPKQWAFFLAHWRARIEAAISQRKVQTLGNRKAIFTLEELLASVLLEEGFVDQRPGKVVDHEGDNRLKLILGVAGIVGKCGVLEQDALAKA
jgi:hypothetical protein